MRLVSEKIAIGFTGTLCKDVRKNICCDSTVFNWFVKHCLMVSYIHC